MGSIRIEDIKNFIVEECMYGEASEEMDLDMNLIELKVIDSLSVVRIVSFLENQTGLRIEFDEVDFDNFASIRAIDNFVKRKLAQPV